MKLARAAHFSRFFSVRPHTITRLHVVTPRNSSSWYRACTPLPRMPMHVTFLGARRLAPMCGTRVAKGEAGVSIGATTGATLREYHSPHPHPAPHTATGDAYLAASAPAAAVRSSVR